MLEFVQDLRGAKFPDEAVMRFFFKEGLHKLPGSVVEFGCGSGNNLLLLFHAYGYRVLGLDRDLGMRNIAFSNFQIAAPGGEWRFSDIDFERPLSPQASERKCTGARDVLLFPGIIYYIGRDRLPSFLKEADDVFAKPDSRIFIRARGMHDYRLHHGEPVCKNGVRIVSNDAGEAGCLSVCYHEWELVDMMRDAFNIDMNTLRVMHIHFENRMMCIEASGVQMLNHDIVLYARKKG